MITSDNSVITSMIHMSLVIPDLGVSLPGKGSTSVVSTYSASRSPTLQSFISQRWVQVRKLNVGSNMPHWPFYSPPLPPLPEMTVSAAPMAVPTADVLLSEIRDLLQKLTDRQPSPEVLATHIALQQARVSGAPSPGAIHVAGRVDDAPEFIPSSIVPTEKLDSSIKSTSREVTKTGMDDASAALRKLKKGNV